MGPLSPIKYFGTSDMSYSSNDSTDFDKICYVDIFWQYLETFLITQNMCLLILKKHKVLIFSKFVTNPVITFNR